MCKMEARNNDVFGGTLSNCVWLERRVCEVKWQERKPETEAEPDHKVV